MPAAAVAADMTALARGVGMNAEASTFRWTAGVAMAKGTVCYFAVEQQSADRLHLSVAWRKNIAKSARRCVVRRPVQILFQI